MNLLKTVQNLWYCPCTHMCASRLYKQIEPHTQTHSQVHQAVPANTQHKMQTLNVDRLIYKHKHASHSTNRQKTTNTKNNTKRRQTEDVTTGNTENTHKHSKLFNPKYLLHRPHMQQNQRNSGTWHQYKIRRKSLQKSQCGYVRSNTPKKNAKICRGKWKEIISISSKV